MRNLLDALDHGRPDDLAVMVPGGVALTYRQLREQVMIAAAHFAHRGLGRKDRIALVFQNSAEAIVLFLAASTAATAAPLNPAYKKEEFRFYLDDTDARAVVLPTGVASSVRDVAARDVAVIEARIDQQGRIEFDGEIARRSPKSDPAPDADDVALVLHTSGTTSRPKQVPLRHRNLLASVDNITRTYGLQPTDRSLCVMPLFHVHGLMASAMATLATGGVVVVPPRFDVLTFWTLVEEHGITWYTAVPTIHQMLVMRNRGERPTGAGQLRFIRSCSSALSQETMRQLESRFGAPVLEAYGMTEASHQMASNPLPPADRRAGSVGTGTGVRIAIMNGEGGMVAGGLTGEVVIQGPSVIDSYANNPEANSASFSNGWFRTGDLGVLDADGYLSLIGRLKEMINRGGEKIAPGEIDEVLLQHPAVAEAVAFGSPHAAWGEEVVAAVVLRSEASEKELIAFARERLADFKVPAKLYFVQEIPRTATGKIQRRTVAASVKPR